MSTDNDRLFACVMGTGISWADRKVQEHGDYKSLAFLTLSDLKLEVYPGCPADLRVRIEADAAKIQARRGEQFQVSTAGQTVTLGYALPPGPVGPDRAALSERADACGDTIESLDDDGRIGYAEAGACRSLLDAARALLADEGATDRDAEVAAYLVERIERTLAPLAEDSPSPRGP